MKIKKLITVIILLLTILSTAFIMVRVYQYVQYFQKFSFTAEKWAEEPLKRHLIVYDMLKKYKFSTMTKEQVTKLLGEPTHGWSSTDKPTRLDNSKKEIGWNYKNSACYIIKLVEREECYGFYLMYDDNGKVIDYSVIYIDVDWM